MSIGPGGKPIRRPDGARLPDAVVGRRNGHGAGVIPADAKSAINYGLDKVRFIAPVKAGARVRTRANLISAEPQKGRRILLKLQCTLEIEGEAKPALVAEVLCMLIGLPDAGS